MSHPVWVRGLKLSVVFSPQNVAKVAPRVGAWIETLDNALKVISVDVAPRVGAWIETFSDFSTTEGVNVAPRVGAWIETRFILISL